MFKTMEKIAELPVPIEEVKRRLGNDWAEIKDDPRLVRGYAESIAVIKQVRAGKVPEGWTGVFECENCGMVYLQPGGPRKILGCPWCINTSEGLPIPRPEAQ
jgi:hypothetical protein